MRRSLAALGAWAVVLSAPALSSAAVRAAAQTGSPTPAASPGSPTPDGSLTPIACHSALDPAQRSVTVVSTMRHRPGTRSLAVRFTLLEKRPGHARVAVRDGDLGRWITPTDPGLGRLPADVWKLRKPVFNLPAPAVYRFRVTLRWSGRHGRVLARRTLHTGLCALRELRPDVLVREVTVRAAGLPSGVERYAAVIANRGRTASGPFAVRFSPRGAGGSAQTVEVPSLAPGARTRVRFLGGICDPAHPPVVLADPAHAVDDFDRANNARVVRCPAGRAGTAGSSGG